ncbi:MAG: hypothetical protein H0V17_12035 [Deltaproteobacteria bacterium]|nr:hypothetical protein [Deltaproteobacteria bacterium]
MASLGAVIALIVLSVGGLVLLGLGVMMIIGAVMPKRSVITSWPVQQEQSFAPFDQRAAGSQSKAWMIAIISAVAGFVLVVGVVLGVKPEVNDVGKTMNMSNLTKKDAPKPAPPAPAPKAEAPAPAPAPEAPKP